MIYIYDGGSLSVTEEEEKKKKKDFYSSSIRLGFSGNGFDSLLVCGETKTCRPCITTLLEITDTPLHPLKAATGGQSHQSTLVSTGVFQVTPLEKR